MTIPANTPFTVQASHDGLNTTKYLLYINGALYPLGQFADGVVTFAVTSGIGSVGEHELVVEAEGPGGSAASAPVTVTIVAQAPTAPTNVQVIV